MRNLPTIFEFNSKKVRTVTIDGQPWFVARDVLLALGIAPRLSHYLDKLDASEKGDAILHTLGGPQRMKIVNESGLYGLTFISIKPEAKKFRLWVTSDLLPTIRQHGGYISPVATDEQIERLQAELHNERIEKKHFQILAEMEGGRAERWRALSQYGDISKNNGLPKLKKRRGAWVADPRFRNSIEIDERQMDFAFTDEN